MVDWENIALLRQPLAAHVLRIPRIIYALTPMCVISCSLHASAVQVTDLSDPLSYLDEIILRVLSPMTMPDPEVCYLSPMKKIKHGRLFPLVYTSVYTQDYSVRYILCKCIEIFVLPADVNEDD